MPAKPSTRSQSDADLSQPCVQAEHHLDGPAAALPATSPDETLQHTTPPVLSAPTSTVATVTDNVVNRQDRSNHSFEEPVDREIAASITTTTTIDTPLQQSATVSAAAPLSPADDRSPSTTKTAETLQTSSPGVTTSDSHTVTADDRGRRRDDVVAIVVEESRLDETHLDLTNTPSDDLMPSLGSVQQRTESEKTAVEMTSSNSDAGGRISVERSVDDGSAVTIRLPVTDWPVPAEEVFYDVDLNDEEEASRKFQHRPASKKKRSLIGLTVFLLID